MYFCCGYCCHMCKSASSSRLFRYFLRKDIVMCARTFHHKIFCRVQKSSTQGVTSTMCNCLFIRSSSKLTASHQRSSAQNLKTSCVVLKSHRLLPQYMQCVHLTKRHQQTCLVLFYSYLRRGELLKYKICFQVPCQVCTF